MIGSFEIFRQIYGVLEKIIIMYSTSFSPFDPTYCGLYVAIEQTERARMDHRRVGHVCRSHRTVRMGVEYF